MPVFMKCSFSIRADFPAPLPTSSTSSYSFPQRGKVGQEQSHVDPDGAQAQKSEHVGHTPGATVNFTPLCLSFPGYKMVIKVSQKCFVLINEANAHKQTSAQNSSGILEITTIIVLGFIIMKASIALQRIYVQMIQGYLSPFSFHYSKTWQGPKGSTKLQT